ncbi:MAG: carboxypeptidase-like regulatory domain-containing protein [Chlorobi bacterium]|nr:carboxypeptidase-like regulatory domain-containing protein [Chlorobiota bacterium]
MKKIVLVLIVFVFFNSCSKNDTLQFGTIKGKVKISPELGINNYTPYLVSVWLETSQIVAITDSAGNYSLLNIPEGTYNIKAQDYLNEYNLIEGKISNITVNGGETVTASDIILTPVNNNVNNFYFNNLEITDSTGYSQYLYPYQDLVVSSSNIKLTGYAKKNYNYYLDTVVSIQINENDIIKVNTSKGWFSQDIILNTSKNDIKVWIGEDENNSNNSSLFETTLVYLNNIQSVNVELNWESDYYSISAGDFDIHLINNNTNDSCWYNNTNPDWGIEDFSYDDPVLYDYTNAYGNSYGSEQLRIYSAANGAYTLKVYYFSNHQSGSTKVTPYISLYLNNSYQTFYAPEAMSVGDTWTVTVINVPFEKSAISINKIEHLSTNYLPKKK